MGITTQVDGMNNSVTLRCYRHKATDSFCFIMTKAGLIYFMGLKRMKIHQLSSIYLSLSEFRSIPKMSNNPMLNPVLTMALFVFNSETIRSLISVPGSSVPNSVHREAKSLCSLSALCRGNRRIKS